MNFSGVFSLQNLCLASVSIFQIYVVALLTFLKCFAALILNCKATNGKSTHWWYVGVYSAP
jgi:hypothetical protein